MVGGGRDGVGRARACSVWPMKDWHRQAGWELPSSQIGSRALTGQHQSTWGITGQQLRASCSCHYLGRVAAVLLVGT